MKIYLNLLPEEKKLEIKEKKDFFKVLYYEFIFSIPIVAFFLILLTINLSLGVKSESLDGGFNSGNLQREYKELSDYEDSFSRINIMTSNILRIQKNHLNWALIFEKIGGVVPDKVHISDLATENYNVSLAGDAKTREDFLKMQENIKSESCFTDVETPLSSLVSKENVEFQINFEVKDECLKFPKGNVNPEA